MSPLEHAFHVVSQVASHLGMQEASLDENNFFKLRVDNDVFLDIKFDEKKDLFLVSSEVAVLPSASSAYIYAYILEFNLVSGLNSRQGFIGLNRNSEQLFYIDHVKASGLAINSFEEFILRTAKIANAWRKLILSPEFLKDASAVPQAQQAII